MRVGSITIVTPCRNAASLVSRTAESIVSQSAIRSGRLRLQYLVCDGASTDGTVDAVRAVCGDAAEIVSEPDRGMYDALAKGLRRATGDVVAYLNAGDFYHPGAFDAVADVMETGASWLTGMTFVCNDKAQPFYTLLPLRFRRRFIRRGVYGRHIPLFIQQEATFWRRELLDAVDLDRLAALKLAGDYYLWRSFAVRAELSIVGTVLGAFTYHRGQLSEAADEYRREMDSICERARPWDVAAARADLLLSVTLPPSVKKKLNPHLLLWDEGAQRWR